MNDNKLINLNFVDGMLEAVMHRFKKIDDTMKAELPAEAPAPNQQLVTDANGAAKWEDRTHYESGLIGFKISPENTRAEEDTTGDVWYIADDKDAGNITPEVRSAMRAITEDFVAHQSERQEYAAYWDGVRYTGRIFRLPGSVYFGDPHSLDTPYMMVSSGGSGILIRVVSKDDAEHTFAYETFDYELKPLDESFLPATVPVIQSASVGQTVVVKAVDENGKPTEWEASNKLNELSEEMGDGFSGSWNDLKDRPFGEMVIGNTVESFTAVTVEGIGNHDGIVACSCSVNAKPTQYVDSNKTFAITINGDTYTDATVVLTNFGGMVFGFGNASLYFGDVSEDTGEPFFWFFFGGSSKFVTKTAGTYEVKVAESEATRLPFENLPEMFDTTESGYGMVTADLRNGDWAIVRGGYIPNAVGENVTSAEFNALLDALRSIGVISY